MAKRTDNLLKNKRPDLWKQLDFDKNEDEGIEIDGLTCGSGKKVWWVCGEGHQFDSAVYSRCGRGNGCPYCSGRKTMPSINSLAVVNPKLARELDKTLNNVTAYDVTANSSKKLWWLCNKGHSYECTVANRNGLGRGCPYCSGHRIIPSVNSLGAVNQELASELHPSRNSVTAYDISPNSNKKLWWVCSNNHEWEASVSSRTRGTGCPVCSNRVVLKGYNDLLSQYPELCEEWDYGKNTISPDSVVYGSGKIVYWVCQHGHKFKTSIYHRVVSDTKCPKCASIRTGVLSLESKIKSGRYKRLVDILQEIPNEYLGDYPLDKVTASSSVRKLPFLCRFCGDIYTTVPISITKSSWPYYGCSRCSKKSVGVYTRELNIHKNPNGMKNRLEELKKIGILWAYDRNIPLPEQFGSFSNYKAFWRCTNCGGYFSMFINNIARIKGCHLCALPHSSASERELISMFSVVLGNNDAVDFTNKFTYKRYRTIDGLFYIDDIPLFVEYDGRYYHKDKVVKDLEKSTHLYTKGLVIRLRENDLELLPEHPNLFQRSVPYGNAEAMESFVDEAVAWARERVVEIRETV